MIYITDKIKEVIHTLQNPKGHNPKDINFYRFIREEGENIVVEIGYWITYTGCAKKYNKETIFVKKSLLGLK